MRKYILLTSLLIISTSSIHANADSNTNAKKIGAFSVTTIAGAVLGGPVGGIAGGITGYYLGKQIEKSDQLEQRQDALQRAQKQLTHLQARVISSEKESEQIAELALQQLQLQLFFNTNESQLTNENSDRVNKLVHYLKQHPQLNISLEGFADTRGNKTYNQKLSKFRVESVETALLEQGIEAERISSSSHGADHAVTDPNSYAKQRVVKIELSESAPAQTDQTLSEQTQTL